MATLNTLPPALAIVALILLHVAVLGSWALRWTGYRPPEGWALLSVGGGLGLTLLGFEVLLLGHLHALTRASICLSGLAMIGGAVWARPRARAPVSEVLRAIGAAARENRVLACSCAAMLVIILVAGLRPPTATDEIEYHWPAPLLWAASGRWVASPYRLTNGPCLAEMLYTISALFANATAAHWTHFLFLVILIAGCAAMTRAIGGRAVAAVAACLSIPVIVNQSSVSYNDVAAAALAIGGYVALLGGGAETLPGRGALLAGGLLFAGAVSTKPLTLVALPAALVYAALLRGSGTKPSGAPIRLAVRPLVLLAGPVLVVLAIWMLHTYALIGRAWDGSGQYLAHTPSDPMWQTGAAAGRVPSVRDIAQLPVVPFITPVLGQREPYGGRTGLMLPFVLFGILGARYLPESQRRKSWWLLFGALAYFLLLGPVAIKTRFHIFVWAALSSFAAIGFHFLQRGSHPVKVRAVACYYALTWLGMADAAHVLLHGLTRFH